MSTSAVCWAVVVAVLYFASSFRAVAEPSALAPDITVALDGSGQFKTVQAAVASVPKENRERVVILVKAGVYREKVRVDAANVTLVGEGREKTRIEFPQLNTDWDKNKDDLGRAILNVNGNDFVMQHLSVANTAGVVGPHAMAVYGAADRTVITDCDVLSEGADTVSLWKGAVGRYYHARCNFRGSVDFVCPRGWCYVVDSTFYETKNTAAIWHDGSKNESQKFVLRGCKFDGVQDWYLARHHHDALFFLLDCTFSKTMADKPIRRVMYGVGPDATEEGKKKDVDNDKSNIWGERSYFHNCHRDGGDYAWFADNLGDAKNGTTPDKITALWTFDGTWDPESTEGPKVVSHTYVEGTKDDVEVKFGEAVTVRGKPRLALPRGEAEYVSGSGTDTLRFVRVDAAPNREDPFATFGKGYIMASTASASMRIVKPIIIASPAR